MSAHPTIDNLERCWASLDELFGSLDDDQFAVPSLCPDWTVRGVMVHLGAVEHMLLGEAPDSMAEAIPFAKAGEWMSRVESLDNAAVLARYRDVIAGRRAEVAALTDADLAAPSMTPVGPGTYGRFLNVRVFDFWVHEQDVRQPLGRRGHEVGPAAEMALAEIEGSLGYIIGRKVGLPDGMGITIELAGPIEQVFHVSVQGRAAQVATLDRPDVVVRTDSTTFALLACGRIDPQGPIDDGRITWTGDQEWGEAAARHLAFTM